MAAFPKLVHPSDGNARTPMPSLETILLTLLLTATVGPLFLVGVYALASYFELRIAAALLDATACALTWQWLIGGWVNLAGGLALAGGGVWLALHDGPLAPRVVGLIVLVPGGLWRAWRGASILGERHRTP